MTNHRGNANQSYKQIYTHIIIVIAMIKKKERTERSDVEIRDTMNRAGENVKWNIHYGKQYHVYQEIKNRIMICSTN